MFTKTTTSLLICLFLIACDAPSELSLSGNPDLSTKAIADYETARSIFWRKLYADGGETLYCAEPFSGSNRSNKGINIEHVFPMSWVKNGLQCGTRKQCRQRSAIFNSIEADLHNLYPSLSDVNYDRSSHSFGEVNGEARRYGKGCDFEIDARARRAEPAPAVRGDIARAMFYMADRYADQGLVIFARQGRILERWHRTDPPDAREMARNDRIEKLQGNRNPFIDDPARLQILIEQGHFY